MTQSQKNHIDKWIKEEGIDRVRDVLIAEALLRSSLVEEAQLSLDSKLEQINYANKRGHEQKQ